MVYKGEKSGGKKDNKVTSQAATSAALFSKLFSDPNFGTSQQATDLASGYAQLDNYLTGIGTSDFTNPAMPPVPNQGIPGGPQMQNIAPPVIMEPKARPAPVAAEQSSTDMLTQLAMSMLSQPGASYDYESAMQQAAQGIRQAYAAEIGAIRSNNKQARKNTKAARKEIEHMYKGLAKLYGREGNQAMRQGQNAADAQMGIATEGNDILTKLNNQMIQDEGNMLQNLGLQAAAPDIISPDFDRMGEQVARNTSEGQRAASAESQKGSSNQRWFERLAGGARFEGVDQSAALLGDLQNYLRQNRDQIGVLKGNRAKEIGVSNANIQGQAADLANQQSGQDFSKVMQLINAVSGIENTDFDNDLAARKFKWDKKMDRYKLNDSGSSSSLDGYPKGIQNAMKIITKTRDPNDQKATNALLELLMGDNAFLTDQVPAPNGKSVKLTPSQAMAIARKKGEEMGLRGKELADFAMAAAATVG